MTIENDDNLCMARAIGVSWAKLMRCTPEEWAEITKRRGNNTNLQLVLEHGKVSETYYKVLTRKKLKQQGNWQKPCVRWQEYLRTDLLA